MAFFADFDQDNSNSNYSQPRTRLTRNPNMYWDQKSTRLLIQLRIEFDPAFEANFGRRNNVWLELANRMAEAGYDFGMEKVSKKWHNILTTYNKNLQKKQIRGYVNWEYFDDMTAYVKTRNESYQLEFTSAQPESGDSNYSEDDEEDEEMVQNRTAAAAPAAPFAKVERDLDNSSPLLVPIEPQPVAHSSAGASLKRKACADIGGSLSKEEPELKRVQPLRIVRKPLPNDDDDDFPAFQDSSSSSTKPSKQATIKEQSKLSALNAEADVSNGLGSDDGDELAWTREYFRQKLALERQRLKIEQDRHRDHMSFQKMTLLMQEKMEKNKLEALRALTEAINRLI